MRRHVVTLCIAFGAVMFTVGTLGAQVFVADANAGADQALYGGFGLDAGVDPAYGVYRFFDSDDLQLPTAAAIRDGTSMKWSGLSNSRGKFVLPGMFIGNVPSKTSYPNELLYLEDVIDGGAGSHGDTNRRMDWELRVGFFEDPTAFVNSRPPNSRRFDLFDGRWETDGVGINLFAGASNDAAQSPVGSSEQYVDVQTFPPPLMGSFFLQSGDPATRINVQFDRDQYPVERTLAGSGTSLPVSVPLSTVAGGVDYGGAMELSWGMELSDPGHADPLRSREVRFHAKLGNQIFSGVFDPGAPDAAVVPNPTRDPGVIFTDGYFDWQSATPVLFLGTRTGAGAETTATHGVFKPGDVNTDGLVDTLDGSIIQSYIGQLDTTYSRGDIDQNGVTDMEDLTLWYTLVPEPTGLAAWLLIVLIVARRTG